MPRTRKAKDSDLELESFDKAQREVDAKIAALEALPEQLELEIKEKAITMPPPEDIVDRERERKFAERAARGQIRNERRTQGQSLLLLFLLILATAAMVSWVVTLSSR